MPTVNEAIKRLQWNNSQHVAVSIWSEDDVIGRAKERGIQLTHAQAAVILDEIDRKQDCSIGINWDVLDSFTDDYLNHYK